MRATARALLALLLTGALAAPAAAGGCDRVVSVGDLHGAYDGFVTTAKEAGLIDDDLRWRNDSACLVQLGDIVDRGPRSRELLDLLMDLKAQAPEEVHVLLGNHEIMDVLGDLRYVGPAEFAAYADDESAEERRRGWEAWLAARGSGAEEEERLRAEFDSAHPPGWFAHRRSFSPQGRYGKWLLERPLVAKIDGTVYVHGGISLSDARSGIEKLNGSVAGDVEEFYAARELLIAAGVITELMPMVEALGASQLWLDAHYSRGSPPKDVPTAAAARRFGAITESALIRSDGPLWYREHALGDPAAFTPKLEMILDELEAVRMVVGHTTSESRRIVRRFDDRVFVIDTGAGPAYGGVASALEISRNGRIRAIYPGRYELLAEPSRSDAWVERILLKGEVVDSKPIGTGISRPEKVRLQYNGQTLSAAFKTIDVEMMRPVYVGEGRELHFTDRYTYDRAAYLLDRRLGMHMVPVTVLRKIDGKQGVLVAWVEDAITEHDRAGSGQGPDDPVRLVRQRAIMRLFDALILNIDRNLGNQLYTLDDWKLHLIDHTRGFRLQRQVPPEFLQYPVDLPRDLYENLKSLELAELRTMMDGVLTKAQVKALLARRDAIVEKVERDRKEYGDSLVFHD